MERDFRFWKMLCAGCGGHASNHGLHHRPTPPSRAGPGAPPARAAPERPGAPQRATRYRGLGCGLIVALVRSCAAKRPGKIDIWDFWNGEAVKRGSFDGSQRIKRFPYTDPAQQENPVHQQQSRKRFPFIDPGGEREFRTPAAPGPAITTFPYTDPGGEGIPVQVCQRIFGGTGFTDKKRVITTFPYSFAVRNSIV